MSNVKPLTDTEKKDLAIEQLEFLLFKLRAGTASCLLCTKEEHSKQITITAPWISWYITIETGSMEEMSSEVASCST